MREGNDERGFTLIELMIVVAIIAILAVIVVPLWTRETRKGKHGSEVNAMFAELSTKLDAYKVESQGVQIASITKCPSTPNTSGYNFTTSCITSGSGWESIRVQPPQSKMYCSYEVVTGAKGSTLTPPAGFLNSQGAAAAEPTLSSSWWYITAECNEDGQSSGANSTFYKSSVDGKLQTQNEGK